MARFSQYLLPFLLLFLIVSVRSYPGGKLKRQLAYKDLFDLLELLQAFNRPDDVEGFNKRASGQTVLAKRNDNDGPLSERLATILLLWKNRLINVK